VIGCAEHRAVVDDLRRRADRAALTVGDDPTERGASS
jgi:hypothetical protein